MSKNHRNQRTIDKLVASNAGLKQQLVERDARDQKVKGLKTQLVEYKTRCNVLEETQIGLREEIRALKQTVADAGTKA